MDATRTVLVFPLRHENILLGKKQSGIGKGLWNGYGGKIHEGESPLRAAVRKLREKSGLALSTRELERVAMIDFYTKTSARGRRWSLCGVIVYLVYWYSGEPRSSKEMKRPTLFPIRRIPFRNMMPADREWLPYVLRGEKIFAEARYGPGQQKLLEPVIITPYSARP